MTFEGIVGAAKARLEALKAKKEQHPPSPAPSFTQGTFQSPKPTAPKFQSPGDGGVLSVQASPSPMNGPDIRHVGKTPELANAKDTEAFKAAARDVSDACGEALGTDVEPPKGKKALDAETKKLYALSATLRRVCTPKPASGKLEVSQEVYKQWKQNGEPRKALLKVLMNAGGDKELFKKRIEHIHKRARRSTIKVQKGYYTKERMKTELKYSSKRIKAIVKYCSEPSRAKKLYVRRDKYENDLREYWVDVETTGSYEAENEEQFVDSTIGEGDAGDSIELGLPAPDRSAVVHSPGEEPDEDSDQEVSEDDGSGSASTRHKVPSKNAVEREHALEAVENVGPVMANLLRVKSKMDTALDKLKALDQTEDVKKSMASVEKFCSTLMVHHDEIADLKSYFDERGSSSFDDEKVKKLQQVTEKIETESSRALMEDTKLRKTLLKAVKPAVAPASKAKAKAKASSKSSARKPKRRGDAADGDDDQDEGEDPPQSKRPKRRKC